MTWELPNDFKYGIYSDGNYLGTHRLFKLDGVWWGLFEYYGEIMLKGFGYRPLKVCSIQDLNNFKSYVLNNKGLVDWDTYQEVLISLNSLTVNYPIERGVSSLITVEKFLSKE